MDRAEMTDAPTTPSPERQPADAGGGPVWHRVEGNGATLLYTLRHKGFRRGVPVDVNDLEVRIQASAGSDSDPEPIIQRILAALSIPAPQAQPDARSIFSEDVGTRFLQERLVELAAMFNVPDGGRYLNDWKARADQINQALSAPAADDGWNFNLSEAPEGEQVILATEGGHVEEAIAPVRDDSDDDWFWAGAGFVHKNTPPIAWRPLPAPPPALHPAAPTEEVGKS